MVREVGERARRLVSWSSDETAVVARPWPLAPGPDPVDARLDVVRRVLHGGPAARVGRCDLGVNRRRVVVFLGEVARLWGVGWPSAR